MVKKAKDTPQNEPNYWILEPSWVSGRKDLSSNEKRVYSYILSALNLGQPRNILNKKVAANYLGISESVFSKSVNKLKKLKLISGEK